MAPSERPPVHIVATGAANLASVMIAFERVGARPLLTEDPRQVAIVSHLVLPGVGAFGSAMLRLEELGILEPLRQRIVIERGPTLAICLGLQLLFEESDESPGVRGIGALPGHVRRFSGAGRRVPHMGWNSVATEPDCEVVESGAAYFANSYFLPQPPPDVCAARTQHGDVTFVSAFEQGNLLACQFHPELSGGWGSRLIRRWMLATGARLASCAPGARSGERPPC